MNCPAASWDQSTNQREPLSLTCTNWFHSKHRAVWQQRDVRSDCRVDVLSLHVVQLATEQKNERNQKFAGGGRRSKFSVLRAEPSATQESRNACVHFLWMLNYDSSVKCLRSNDENVLTRCYWCGQRTPSWSSSPALWLWGNLSLKVPQTSDSNLQNEVNLMFWFFFWHFSEVYVWQQLLSLRLLWSQQSSW